MSNIADTFLDGLDRRVDGIIDACTQCGKCAEVCPTPAIAGIGDANPESLATGVIDILKGETPEPSSEIWARKCCGTGDCIDACPEGINPRFMLTMARRALNEPKPADARKQAGRTLFQGMSKGVRMLSRLQMPPEVLARLNPPSNRAAAEHAPDIVFYTGCNLLKTPHIGLLCLDVLDKIDVSYEVYGGPGNCCGVLQLRPGDTGNAGRQLMSTVDRFAETGAKDVVAWCPTCHIQFSEIALPNMDDDVRPDMDSVMFPTFLADRLDTLKPHMTQPVNKKVALFEFPGARGVTEAVTKLLSAIDGIEIIDLGHRHAGYQMSALDTLPEYRQRSISSLFRDAEDAGIDAVLSVFHADHRELSSHAPSWPFEILNYMDVLGESMGLYHEDLFKRLKAMQDADRIVADMTDTVQANGMDLDQMRDAVLTYMIDDQHLPIDRAAHPKP